MYIVLRAQTESIFVIFSLFNMITLTMVLLMSGNVCVIDAVLVDVCHVRGHGVGRVTIVGAQVGGGKFRAAQ